MRYLTRALSDYSSAYDEANAYHIQMHATIVHHILAEFRGVNVPVREPQKKMQIYRHVALKNKQKIRNRKKEIDRSYKNLRKIRRTKER